MKRTLMPLSAVVLALGLALSASVSLANLGAEESPASDEPNYVQGKKALEDKDYKGAIAALGKAVEADKNNADIHNYLGFAYRSAGDLDNALKHYNKALSLSPAHKAANEYIGEAYLMKKDLAKAEEHLNKLRGICATGCAELTMLKDKIDEFKKKGG
jgi:Flp pilus assembly protein TadD